MRSLVPRARPVERDLEDGAGKRLFMETPRPLALGEVALQEVYVRPETPEHPDEVSLFSLPVGDADRVGHGSATSTVSREVNDLRGRGNLYLRKGFRFATMADYAKLQEQVKRNEARARERSVARDPVEMERAKARIHAEVTAAAVTEALKGRQGGGK